jgi:uncharacterized RDD family membrane protein YckC
MRGAELQLDRLDLPFDCEGEDSFAAVEIDAATALKREVAERLAAHRKRRGRQTATATNLIPIPESRPARHHPSPSAPQPNPAKPRPNQATPQRDQATPQRDHERPQRANRIAAAVAERYAQTPSYRDFLAAEAARALDEANAKAEIAARNAQALAAAQQQLLAELDLWGEPEPPRERPSPAPPRADQAAGVSLSETIADASSRPSTAHPSRLPTHASSAELSVRLYEGAAMLPPQAHAAVRVNQPAPTDTCISEEELFALDDEIAFRQAPQFPPPATPPVPIPANLLEFPRQLVAPRKARPRVAEGPLREEADTTPDAAQLRIFEVEPGQIATAPDLSPATVPTDLPIWSTIRLDAAPEAHSDDDALNAYTATSLADDAAQNATQAELHATLPFATASLAQRSMAALVDGCILGFTFLSVAAGFTHFVPALPPAPVAAMAAAATLLVLFVLYQMLFFTFACATPGMRYARIGLCTFADENPTRAEMRRRTWALLLSACPLGLGFLWALLDEDRLGWHDRISRMYQRGY